MQLFFFPKAAALALMAAAPAHSVAQTATPEAKTAPAASPSGVSSRADLARSLNESFRKIDADNDGNVGSAELSAYALRMRNARASEYVRGQDDTFARFDTDKDGLISKDEFRRGTAKAQPAPVDVAAVLEKLDRNDNQLISSAEYGAAILANFDRLDSNHDGFLSDGERKLGSK